VADRRSLLEALLAVPTGGIDAASSGCAEDGAFRLALKRSEAAELALSRLAVGREDECLTCGGPIGAERLMAVVTAVRCAGCAH
jgi:RNA polymerase-binding transcription factor DksA